MAMTRLVTISKRFEFVETGPGGPGDARAVGEARYLDYEPLEAAEREVALQLREEAWLRAGVDNIALDWAVEHGMPGQLAAVRERVSARVGEHPPASEAAAHAGDQLLGCCAMQSFLRPRLPGASSRSGRRQRSAGHASWNSALSQGSPT